MKQTFFPALLLLFVIPLIYGTSNLDSVKSADCLERMAAVKAGAERRYGRNHHNAALSISDDCCAAGDAFTDLHRCAHSHFRGVYEYRRMFIPSVCLHVSDIGGNYNAWLCRTSGKRRIREHSSWIFGIILLVLRPTSRKHWNHLQIRFKRHQCLPSLAVVRERCGNRLF